MRGHLKQRSKGSWTVWVELAPDPVTGKRRRQTFTVRGTKRDAEGKLTEVLGQVNKGSYVKPDKGTVGELLSQWLAGYAESHVRARTLEGYQHVITRHLIPGLGHIPLTRLQTQHLNEYYASKKGAGRLDGEEGGLSTRTILSHHRILHEALSYALKGGIVNRNVAEAADPPRVFSKEMHILDADGIGRLLDAARSTPYYALFHLAVYTGMRRSELLGLRWKDVDLDMATLSVVQCLHHLLDGRTVLEQPKTAKSRRMIALPPGAVLTLKEHRRQQEALLTMSDDTPVFCHYDGSPLLPNSVTHAFTKCARREGLTPIRLHDLRHSHASLMLRQGVHPKIVQERLGHATIAITLDTYSHVTPGLQEAAALKFEAGLNRDKALALAR